MGPRGIATWHAFFLLNICNGQSLDISHVNWMKRTAASKLRLISNCWSSYCSIWLDGSSHICCRFGVVSIFALHMHRTQRPRTPGAPSADNACGFTSLVGPTTSGLPGWQVLITGIIVIRLNYNLYNHVSEHLFLDVGPIFKLQQVIWPKAVLFGESVGPVVATVQENGETRATRACSMARQKAPAGEDVHSAQVLVPSQCQKIVPRCFLPELAAFASHFRRNVYVLCWFFELQCGRGQRFSGELREILEPKFRSEDGGHHFQLLSVVLLAISCPEKRLSWTFVDQAADVQRA